MADPKTPIPNERIKFWKTEIPTSEHWAIKIFVLLLSAFVIIVLAVAAARSGQEFSTLAKLFLE